MPAIQIDMFEVQLGAAMLLSFEAGDGTVRVLADGGIKASQYRPEHVLNKLGPLFAGGPRRLDLVIGTHYDEDHLLGLVPIIDDPTIDIGEAWMPPVADDSDQFAVDTAVAGPDLLVRRFSGDGGAAALDRYVGFKRQEIDRLLALEQLVAPEGSPESLAAGALRAGFFDDDPQAFLRAQLAGAPDDGCDHGIEPEVAPNATVEQLRQDLLQGKSTLPLLSGDLIAELGQRTGAFVSEVPEVARAQARSLANLRRANARDAINAVALHAVVQALDRRNIPIRCEIITDGTPRRYRWKPAQRRFVLSRTAGKGLSFTLLGPSASLVRKHRDKLPVLESSKLALAFRGEIRSITPSNQLSYIGCFRCAGQSILVTGDAGCVDFALNRDSYHPALLAALQPLHVIQVAHHGGNNAHFYRVLAAAGYPEQDAPSFLLLSHAVHDRTRPSDVFHDFLLTALDEGDDIRLLFTSEPSPDKVQDYRGAIHPPVGGTGAVGDVQLRYDQGWTVTRHAVAVA